MRIKVRLWAVVLVALGLTACSPLLVKPLSTSTQVSVQSYARLDRAKLLADRSSVYKVLAYAGNIIQEGSGIVVGRDRILTNFYVIRNAGTIYVRSPQGLRLSVASYAASPSEDLALLSVPGLRAAPIAFAPASPPLGLPVFAVGYPAGGPEQVTSGRIVGTAEVRVTIEPGQFEGYVLTVRVEPGNSGGPLLDRAGEVVGVVFAKAATANGPSFALLWTTARSFLRANGITDQ